MPPKPDPRLNAVCLVGPLTKRGLAEVWRFGGPLERALRLAADFDFFGADPDFAFEF
jgi:hypothetical protein